MRNISFIILAFLTFINTTVAQIHGNKNIVTQEIEMEDFSSLVINLNIDIEVVVSGDRTYAEVTTDENIIPYINLTPKNEKLNIDQKEWIESSGTFKMVIYNPNLVEVYNDSWVDLRIRELDQETFTLYSEMSDISVSGKVKEASIISENSAINLTDLTTDILDASVSGKGRIIVNESTAPIVKARKTRNVMTQEEELEYLSSDEFVNARFINVNIKNNKWKGFSAYVKGPKKNGKYFSYGLKFRPRQTKKERWTIGTKLYKVNKSGEKSLVYTVKESDENQTIKLWE